jgi:hypothetical protein
LTAEGAKALMLKDSDYSTPQDHYFGHLQRRKSDPIETDQVETKIISELNVSVEEVERLQAVDVSKVMTMPESAEKKQATVEIYNRLPQKDKEEVRSHFKVESDDAMRSKLNPN